MGGPRRRPKNLGLLGNWMERSKSKERQCKSHPLEPCTFTLLFSLFSSFFYSVCLTYFPCFLSSVYFPVFFAIVFSIFSIFPIFFTVFATNLFPSFHQYFIASFALYVFVPTIFHFHNSSAYFLLYSFHVLPIVVLFGLAFCFNGISRLHFHQGTLYVWTPVESSHLLTLALHSIIY